MPMGWERTAFTYVFPALPSRRRPMSSHCFSALAQGDPGRLRNSSAKLGSLDGKVIFHLLRRECEMISRRK